MSIGSIGSSAALSSLLQAKGLASDTIDLIEDDLELAQKAGGSQMLATSINGGTVRTALDKQISDDVTSGKLSEEDAAKIGEALDQLEGKTTEAKSGSALAGGAARPAGGGGGGGAGGSSEKTELSRTVTVSGGITTTIITYTDGTTETETSVATEEDIKSSAAKSGKSEDVDKSKSGTDATAKPGAASDPAVQDYLAQIEPGSILEAYA
jgi:hypothetical protein